MQPIDKAVAEVAEVANYIKKINEPVVESEVIFNPTAEFSVFTNKAEEFEFYGYQNLDDVLELKSNSMTFTDAEIGSLISSKLKNESGLLYLGELLKLNKQDIYDACYKKMRIIDERLNSDY